MLFEIRPSKTFILLLCVFHLLAIFSVLLTNLVLWARIGIFLSVAASFSLSCYRHLRLSWHSFSLSEKEVLISLSDGNVLSAKIAPETLVTASLVVLCARSQETFVSQLIFRDAMPEDAFRDLRVRLSV